MTPATGIFVMDEGRQYYRLEAGARFGVIASPECNVLYRSDGKEVFGGALESVVAWNLRTGALTGSWADPENRAVVTYLAAHPQNPDILAAGYDDGSIRIWNVVKGEAGIVFRGHKTAVTALCFDAVGSRLSSGSKDTDIVLWDLASESGMYRLRGHNNAVTALAFLSDEHVVSASKDSTLRLWDLQAQHCVETVVVHPSEVAGFFFTPDRSMMITAGADQFLRLFKIDLEAMQNKLSMKNDETDGVIADVFTFMGEVQRSSKDRTLQITLTPSELAFGVLSGDRTFELFSFSTVEDVKRKLQRRRKRQKEKSKKDAEEDEAEAEPEAETVLLPDESTKIQPADMIKSTKVFRLADRARSFAFKTAAGSKLRTAFVLNTNSVEEYEVDVSSASSESYEPALTASIDLPGHRAEAKVVAVSAGGSLVLSASKESIKLWNAASGACVRTLECEDTLCAHFIRSDEYVLVGTKAGQLRVFEVASGRESDVIGAHEGAIWSIAMRPDRKGFATGSADKSVKFWEFKSSTSREGGFRLKHIRTLQVAEDVLCVKYSPDCRYIAASLLDLTVKVFFEDSLKFYLNLFGHKLPVMALDISHDSRMLLTASADKNIKVWGLDFGDCRKSIFAHQEAITAVAFLPRTYQFVSASKDGVVKYWTDEQEWSMLQKLEGHHGEIWSLALAPRGQFLATVSSDRSIRIFNRTEEPLFLDEEKERQMEEVIESSILAGNPHDGHSRNEEVGEASQKSLDTLRASERIVDALVAADEETEKWKEYETAKAAGQAALEPTPGPYFQTIARGKTPAQFLMKTFEGVPLADLDLALLSLSTDQFKSLFKYIELWLEGNVNVSLTSAILRGIITINYSGIVADAKLRISLERIRALQKQKLVEFRDLLGLNVQVMRAQLRHYEHDHAKMLV